MALESVQTMITTRVHRAHLREATDLMQKLLLFIDPVSQSMQLYSKRVKRTTSMTPMTLRRKRLPLTLHHSPTPPPSPSLAWHAPILLPSGLLRSALRCNPLSGASLVSLR